MALASPVRGPGPRMRCAPRIDTSDAAGGPELRSSQAPRTHPFRSSRPHNASVTASPALRPLESL